LRDLRREIVGVIRGRGKRFSVYRDNFENKSE
jgi:hypothetical protein